MTQNIESATKPVVAIVNQYPNLLEKAEDRVSKMKKFYDMLIESSKSGIDSELDGKLKEFIEAAKVAKCEMNKERSPITRKLTEISKAFTAKENEAETLIAGIQKIRNAYAKKVAEENRKAEILGQQKRMKDEEAINLKAEIEMEFRIFVQSLIESKCKSIIAALGTITDENKEQKHEGLKQMSTEISTETLYKFETKKASKFNNNPTAICSQVKILLAEDMKKYFNTEVNDAKQDALIKFEDYAALNETERQAQIKLDEIRNQVESESALEVAQANIEASTDAEKAAAAFNSIAETTEAPEAKVYYEIEVNGAKGYAAIVAYWFATLGKEFAVEKFPNKTIKSMIGDLERHSLKFNERLENDSVKYVEKYKAK